jgi:hypothetical protein
METYFSAINEQEFLSYQSINEEKELYYVHVGKGFTDDGFRMFRYPADFTLMTLEEIFDFPRIKYYLLNYINEKRNELGPTFNNIKTHDDIVSENLEFIIQNIFEKTNWYGAEVLIVPEEKIDEIL